MERARGDQIFPIETKKERKGRDKVKEHKDKEDEQEEREESGKGEGEGGEGERGEMNDNECQSLIESSAEEPKVRTQDDKVEF